MAVRNFRIECEIDGRKTKLSGGPQGKEGGFKLTVYIRDKGKSVHGCALVGRVNQDSLQLEIWSSETHRICVKNR